MTDPQLANELSLFESLSKIFAVVLGVLYLLGFLVVASYLSRFGVSSFSVLQLQYLIAGTWVLGPPLVHASIVYTSQRFSDRASPITGKFNWRRFLISSCLTGTPTGLFFALLLAIPKVLEGLTWGKGLRLIAFYLGMVICAQMFWSSRQAGTDKESFFINRRDAAPFYLALLLMIVISYAVWFSVRIYPLIPFSLGGGRPLTVEFFEGEKRMPDEIKRNDQSTKRSIPYKLLLATDKSYVVVSPSDKERSVEISRDSVAGMVVLD